jgi:hypothetical protein
MCTPPGPAVQQQANHAHTHTHSLPPSVLEQEGLQIYIDQPMQFNIQFLITPDSSRTSIKYLAKPRVRNRPPFAFSIFLDTLVLSSLVTLLSSLYGYPYDRLSRPSFRPSTSPG